MRWLEAEIARPEQLIDPGLHFVADGQFQGIALAHDAVAIGQAERQFQVATARIAAEDFMELFELRLSVGFLEDADSDAAGVSRGEIFQGDDLVDDQVGLFAARPLVDRAADDTMASGLISSS